MFIGSKIQKLGVAFLEWPLTTYANNIIWQSTQLLKVWKMLVSKKKTFRVDKKQYRNFILKAICSKDRANQYMNKILTSNLLNSLKK